MFDADTILTFDYPGEYEDTYKADRRVLAAHYAAMLDADDSDADATALLMPEWREFGGEG